MSNSNQITVRTFERRNVFLEKEIGKGRFGKVYLASIVDANLPLVAIKVIKADYTTNESLKKGRDSAYDELLKAAVLDHENVVKLYGMIQEQDFPWLVFEYMSDGNLQEFVIRNEPVKEKILINICSQVSCGMAFLHNSGFVHKDLAARNILLKGNVAKIADLGLSSFLNSNATIEEDGVYTLNGKVFPFRHAAVECIVEQIFTFGSDVWSFGILMYEIFSGGMTPYGKENKEPEVRRFIAEGITPLHLAEPKCSSKILSLMRFILNPNLKERPTFQKLVEMFHKLISGTNSPEGAASQTTFAYPAVPSFHNLQHSKSGSANNIMISNSLAAAGTFHPAPQDYAHVFNDPFLGVPLHHSSSRSSSSPDLLDPLLFKGIRVTLNGKQSQRQHEKSESHERTLLGDFYEDISRRHSNGNVGFPLHQYHSSSSNMKKLQSAEFTGFDEQYEPRRASITSDNDNPLLKGFVQNRFNRKTHSSVHNV